MTLFIAEFALAAPAGVIVMISLFFAKQRKLRILNLAGSLLFVVYGVWLVILSGLVTGWTTVVLNAVCSFANVKWLYMNRKALAETPYKEIPPSPETLFKRYAFKEIIEKEDEN